MYNVPLDYFISPITKEELTLDSASGKLMDSSGNAFEKNAESGFWNFIPERSPLYSDEQWNTFYKLISNFLISYNKHPEVNVSYDVRDDALAFGQFCKYHGKVLDIGCGPHKIPSYIKFKKNPDAEYYGIDVIPGEHPKELNFVQAMGEHLPFKNDMFDVTISGTSIMHYVDVKAGIQEAMRVTKKDGYLCLWLGVKKPEAPKPTNSPDWYQELEIPEGAENPFHYRRSNEKEFAAYFKDCGFEVVETETFPIDEFRYNVFFRIKK